MDIFTGNKIIQDVLVEIEQKIERKLTDEEKYIAEIATQKGIFRGMEFERSK